MQKLDQKRKNANYLSALNRDLSTRWSRGLLGGSIYRVYINRNYKSQNLFDICHIASTEFEISKFDDVQQILTATDPGIFVPQKSNNPGFDFCKIAYY